jgi:hypothetical protein
LLALNRRTREAGWHYVPNSQKLELPLLWFVSLGISAGAARENVKTIVAGRMLGTTMCADRQ